MSLYKYEAHLQWTISGAFPDCCWDIWTAAMRSKSPWWDAGTELSGQQVCWWCLTIKTCFGFCENKRRRTHHKSALWSLRKVSKSMLPPFSLRSPPLPPPPPPPHKKVTNLHVKDFETSYHNVALLLLWDNFHRNTAIARCILWRPILREILLIVHEQN